MLRMKFLAGLFEHPYADADYAETITDNAEARALAIEAARKVVVLLKNDGTLPLQSRRAQDARRDRPQRGDRAARRLFRRAAPHVTMLEGIKAKVGDRVKIVHAEGVRITDQGDWWTDDVMLAKPAENRARIAEAVKVAQAADAIVLAVGGNAVDQPRSLGRRTTWATRTSIELVGEQNELARAMFALGKPVVVVLINGRPLSVAEHRRAGERAGRRLVSRPGRRHRHGRHPVRRRESGRQAARDHRALRRPAADVLQPEAERPSRLPVRYRRSRCSRSASGSRTRRSRSARPCCRPPASSVDGSVTVSVDVRNTGKVAGDEVVQLYVRDVVSSVTRPVKELKGFSASRWRRARRRPSSSRSAAKRSRSGTRT